MCLTLQSSFEPPQSGYHRKGDGDLVGLGVVGGGVVGLVVGGGVVGDMDGGDVVGEVVGPGIVGALVGDVVGS